MNLVPRWRLAVFAAVPAILILLSGEAVLRLAGFRYEQNVSYMEFNFPNPHELHQIFEPDPELLWRMRPGFEFGEGYLPLNGAGFRGTEFSLDKPAGELRIACLGDSVTFGRGEAAYPDILENILSQRLGRRVETMNFGVPGYSSWQGRKLLGRVLSDYRPDAVIIIFGWNDHWLAKGFADRAQAAATPRDRPFNPLAHLRLYQFLHRAADRTREALSPPPLTLRVAPDDYRANLSAMIAACREQNVTAVLATAPSAIGAGKNPDYLTALQFIRDDDDLARLHREYNEIARSVAREQGAALVDLDRVFGDGDVTRLFNDPERDLIHPNADGYGLMARALAGALEAGIK